MRCLILALAMMLAWPVHAAAPENAPAPLMTMIGKAAARADKPNLLIDVLMMAIETAPSAAGALINHAIAAAPQHEIAILRALGQEQPALAGSITLAGGTSPADRLAAHDAQPKPGFFSAKGWDGEVALGGSHLTGNTEEQAVTLGIKLDHKTDAWEHHFDTTLDYSRNTGVTTKERLLSNYQAKWFFSDRGYGFGQANFEFDKFSEFDWRLAEAVGLGYRVWEWSTGSWDLEGGPGSRQTKLAANGTQTEFIGVLASNVRWAINDKLRFTNKSSVFIGNDRTTLSNDAAFSISLTDSWSGRLSFYIQHDSSVPLGQEKTDTASRLSVVYGF